MLRALQLCTQACTVPAEPTATAQCRALGGGALPLVANCFHLYSSGELVSSSYRSLKVCALPAAQSTGLATTLRQQCQQWFKAQHQQSNSGSPFNRPLPPNTKNLPPQEVKVWPDLAHGPEPAITGSSQLMDCKAAKAGSCYVKACATLLCLHVCDSCERCNIHKCASR